MTKSKKQKFYKMKGCSKKNKSRKHLGGSMNLAYTGKPIFSLPNPHLAYTGANTSSTSSNINSSNMRTNTNAENPVYPNTGGLPTHQNWINSSTLRGGSCGGTCGLLQGGALKHRTGCKCSTCKGQKGGNGLPYGQGLGPMKPILAPNGLTGQNWGANFKWPGTNGVGGDFNHYSLNKYAPVDISRQMQDIGAQPPFLGMGGGKRKTKGKGKGKGKSRKQRGGGLSNFMYQDLVNVGRQFQYGLGSTYNALRGYESPVNPMPWQQPGLSNPSVFRQ
jgi:hypothetical protein